MDDPVLDGMKCSVVAYLPGPLGEFVDGLRKRLNPRFANWLAHVSILPPRPLPPHPEDVLPEIREKCLMLEPFVATLGEVQTFWPVNGVVYLSISVGAERLVGLHGRLNCGYLERVEPYPYVPHVTLAQELDEAATQAVLAEASQEWTRYPGTASFRVDSLSLVRQEADQRWVDLAPIPLGGVVKPSRR